MTAGAAEHCGRREVRRNEIENAENEAIVNGLSECGWLKQKTQTMRDIHLGRPEVRSLKLRALFHVDCSKGATAG